MITRTETLTQTMTTQTQVQETSINTPGTDSLFMSATSSMTPETSLKQRTTSEAKAADNAIVAAFAFFNALRQQAKAIGVELAVFCRLDRHGILGKLFCEDARSAKALCEMRLADLKEDQKTFSDTANTFTGRKDKAAAMLTEMEAALTDAEEQPARFLDLLAEYEAEFGKVSFLTILDARFMMIDGTTKFDLRTVTKEGTFVSSEQRMKEITAELGRKNGFEDTQATEAAIAEAGLIQVTPDLELTEEALLEAYIQNNPALVARMVTSWAVNQLLMVETSINRGLAQSAIDMKPAAEAIRNMLKVSEDLQNDIMVDISRLHTGRIFNELSTFEAETASVEELLAARQQCLVFNQLQKGFEGELSTAEVCKQKAELKARQVEIAARLIQLYTASETEKPAGQRLFWLNTPATEQIKAKLAGTELMESTEKALYKNILTYMDARTAFAKTADHKCLTTMQQARFDLLRSQQHKLTEEMEAQTAGTPATSALGNGDFHADMALLETIYQIRQTTARYRPVETAGENVLRIGANIIWRDELTLNEVKARLAHNYHLKQLDYSFKKEFMALCGDCPETFRQARSGLTTIAGKTAEGIKALFTNKTGLFTVLGLSTEAYNGVQTTLGETLKEMLEVAESNPVAFRRMCGDFAQLVPQLKLMVGANTELTNVIDQLDYRFSAEAFAACATGEKVANLDEAIDPKSRLAKNLKRFQFFCDLSAGLLKGATGVNVITSALSGPVGIARALFNVGTMIITREMTNRMPADEVRMLHKLFRYGPVACWYTASPFEIAGNAVHNTGHNKGLATSIASAVFAPFIKRYNALSEAIMNVYNHKPGAWTELAFEGAKTTAILAVTTGATCAAASTLSLSGSVLATAGAAATAGFTIYSVSYMAALFISNLEETTLLARAFQGVEMFVAQQFSGNSKIAKSIRLKCQAEAANVVAAMKKKDAYQQEITEKTARALYKKYWDNAFAMAHRTHLDKADSFLAQSKEKREQQAAELARHVETLRVIEKNLQKASEIGKSNEQLAELRQQLKDLGIDQRAPEAGLTQFLLNLKQEMNASIQRQCGTNKPGVTARQIEESLAIHQKEVMLGSVIREILTLEDAGNGTTLVAEAADEAEKAHCKQIAEQMAGIEQQRLELMHTEALKQLIEDRKAEGQELTVSTLKKMNLEAVLKPRIERLYAELKSVNGQRVEQFKTQLQALPLMQKLSAVSRSRVMAAATAA